MHDKINLQKCYEADLSTHTLPLGRAVAIQDEGKEGIAVGTLHGNKILPRAYEIAEIKSQLAEKAAKSDLNTTNTNVANNTSAIALKANQADLNATNAELTLKADKTEVTNVMTPKGNIAYASLPTIGNTVGWYYYCPDGDGTHGAGNYVWNGTSWYFGGTGDDGYNKLKEVLVYNILTDVSFLNGYYIDNATGAIQTLSAFKCTDYVRCTLIKKLKIKRTFYYGGDGLAFYDVNKNFISGYGVTSGNTYFEIDVPTTAYYFRISGKSTDELEVYVANTGKEISSIIDGVVYNKNDISKLNNDMSLFKDDLVYDVDKNALTYTTIGNESKFANFKFIKGRRYKFTNNTTDNVTLNLYKNYSNVQTVSSSVGVGESLEFVCETDEANQVGGWCQASGNLKIELVTIRNEIVTQSVNQIKNKPFIIVDVNGNGDFTDIQSAINYAKNTFDVINESITIYIRNGVYNVEGTNVSPYYAIDKGSNRINLLGESRDGVIIKCVCTSTKQGIALNIGGQCTIENITIKELIGDGYNSTTHIGDHKNYALHNDTPVQDSTEPYYTTVKNCKLYSECNTPVGAGLQNNQVQRYENVECIYAKNAVVKQQGSLYVHAPYSSSFIANGLEIVDCTLVSYNERPAISLGNVSGSQVYSNIPQTYIRNVTASAGVSEVVCDGFNKTIISKGNSNSALNYN